MLALGRRRRAYWSSGGAVLSRAGPLATDRSLALLQFYGRLALDCEALGDAAGARHCAGLACQLGAALLAADDWRRAALGCAPADGLKTLGVLRQQLRSLGYG